MSAAKKKRRKKGSRKGRKNNPTLSGNSKCLGENVRDAMERYFRDLDGYEPTNLYELVISQVEKPLIESVIDNTRGNISHAAQLLGMNRGTLRSRMQKYGLDK